MDGVVGSPFSETAYKDDPRLDPTSDQFNSRFWIKNLKAMLEADTEYYKPTSLGVAYKNLRAQGTFFLRSDFSASTRTFVTYTPND